MPTYQNAKIWNNWLVFAVIPLVLSLNSIFGIVFDQSFLFHIPFLTGMSQAAALSFLPLVALILLNDKGQTKRLINIVLLILTAFAPALRLIFSISDFSGFLPHDYLEFVDQFAIATAVVFLLFAILIGLRLFTKNRILALRIFILTVVFILVSKDWAFYLLRAFEIKENSIFDLMSAQSATAFTSIFILSVRAEIKLFLSTDRNEKWKYLGNFRQIVNTISVISLAIGIWLVVEVKKTLETLSEQQIVDPIIKNLKSDIEWYTVNLIVLVLLLLALTFILIMLQKLLVAFEKEDRKILEQGFNYFSQVYMSSPDATVAVDTKGTIVDVNQQFENIFGWKRELIINKSLSVIIPDRYRANHLQFVEGFSRNPYRRPMGLGLNLFGLKSDKSEFPVEISLGSIRQNDKLILLATVRDITVQKVNEAKINELNSALESKIAELEKANEEMKAFSYAISHDLRAPLRAIIGFSKIIQEDYLNKVSPDVADLLKIVISSASKMGQQIDGLLQMNRLSTRPLQKEKISLSSLVADLKDVILSGVNREHYKFFIEPDLFASCDMVLMRICLQNLIENAVKFSAKVPEAEIKFYCSDPKKNIFCIEDNGAGFDSGKATNLFMIFHRQHADNEFQGLGIGLATVHKIIKIHGGSIWAESNPGKGAKFYFTLGNDGG